MRRRRAGPEQGRAGSGEDAAEDVAGRSRSRAISQLDFETKKNTVDVDQAQVQAAQAALENAKLNLEYCYIHSPIDGRAGARLVDVGNVVQANTTALLSIQRLDPIYADFTVTESDLPEVQKAMERHADSCGAAAFGCRKCRREPGKRRLSRQRRAERHRHGKPARHDAQSRSSFLAGTICGRHAGSGHGERGGADSEPGHADQPARARSSTS